MGRGILNCSSGIVSSSDWLIGSSCPSFTLTVRLRLFVDLGLSKSRSIAVFEPTCDILIAVPSVLEFSRRPMVLVRFQPNKRSEPSALLLGRFFPRFLGYFNRRGSLPLLLYVPEMLDMTKRRKPVDFEKKKKTAATLMEHKRTIHTSIADENQPRARVSS